MPTSETDLTPALLSQMAGDARRANWAIQTARTGLFRQIDRIDGETPDTHLMNAQNATERLASRLHRAGGIATAPRPGADDLAALLALDTPAARELLALLERALPLAEQVDAERGATLPADVPNGEGESRGCDFAEVVSVAVRRLRLDTQAPKGRD